MRRFLVTVARILAVIGATGFLAGPYIDVLPVICPFRAVTGRRCIFCGMSHAITFVMRGDLANAGAAHPLWFIVLPLFTFCVAAVITERPRLSWGVANILAAGTVWTAMNFD